MKFRFCVAGATLGVAFSLFGAQSAAAADKPAPVAPRPNIVFILTDDLRADDISGIGQVYARTPHIDRIAKEGVRFNNAFVTTPLCSPSRASFLTGQYAHRHGITDNTDHDAASMNLNSFPKLLHAAGYTTAFVGKWHMGTNDAPRPGFDRWVGVAGQGEYLDPTVNIDGTRKQVKNDYVTDVFTDYAVDFLKKDYDKPFCLVLAHKAVHPDLTQFADGSLSDPSAGKFIPADRHKKLYADQAIERRPNFGAPVGKPALQRKLGNLPPLSAKTGTNDETVRNRLRMLAAVDESVERIYEILQDTRKLDNTLIIFTSDEGYFYGEHGLSVERRLAYEESIRIPLLMRYPQLIKPRSQVDEMVLNLDIAPTLLDLAGVAVPADVEGRSIVPLLRNDKVVWRQSFLIEYFADRVFPRTMGLGYQAVRTTDSTYIHYTDLDNMDELYNVLRDPYQQKNLFQDGASQDQVLAMQAELVKLLKAGRTSVVDKTEKAAK